MCAKIKYHKMYQQEDPDLTVKSIAFLPHALAKTSNQ